MSISFTGVVAMASDRAIGKDNGIPWRLPEDMRTFKRITMGHPILMGRKTWESLGRPLPGRQNIVLTRSADFRAEGAVVIRDWEELRAIALQDSEIMVIGGAQIYALLLPHMNKLYVSEVHGTFPADTYFPPFSHLFSSPIHVQAFSDFDLLLYERNGINAPTGEHRTD